MADNDRATIGYTFAYERAGSIPWYPDGVNAQGLDAPSRHCRNDRPEQSGAPHGGGGHQKLNGHPPAAAGRLMATGSAAAADSAQRRRPPAASKRLSKSTFAERLTLLQHSPFISKLSEEEQVHIAKFAEEKLVGKNVDIFRKGDISSNIMIVLDGLVRLRTFSGDGGEITFVVIKSGDVFGEIAMFDGQGREADAVSCTHSRLMVVDKRHILSLVAKNFAAALYLFSLVSERARSIFELAESLAFSQVSVRVAKALVMLAEPHHGAAPTAARINVKLSQRDLASMAATSRETINKILRQWQRDGIIGIDTFGITIAKPQELQLLARL